MSYEIIVEEFVLQVEVTDMENTPAAPGTWDSDLDFYGSRYLEFKVTAAATYDERGRRQIRTDHGFIAREHAKAIETALWFEIDSLSRRRRAAA